MSRITQFALASAIALTVAMGATGPADARPKSAAAAARTPLPPGAVEEWATLRDGTKLAANVYKPEGKGPWPVVISRTP